MEITTKRQIKIPSVPDFILTADGESIPIADLSEEDLIAVAQAWTRELLIKAQNRRHKS